MRRLCSSLSLHADVTRKYGNVHRQLRALVILDALIQNAGPRFQKGFADEALLERLRVAGTDTMADPAVRAKARQLFGQWSVSYKDTPGMERVTALYRQLPQRKQPVRQNQSKVLRETEAEAAQDSHHDSSPPKSSNHSWPSTARTTTSISSSTSNPATLSPGPNLLGKSKKDKKKKGTSGAVKYFNLEKEKPAMMQSIAGASVASTNLTNALKLVNREQRRVSEDPEVMKRFEVCKSLRRQILRYIQFVESDDYLGGLIHANDELINALMAFEVLDKSIEDDSDSELEEGKHLSRIHGHGHSTTTTGSPGPDEHAFAGLSVSGSSSPPTKPPRPMSIPMPPAGAGKARQVESDDEESDATEEEDDDENNPFGDSYAAATPAIEKKGYSWKEV